MQYKEYNDNELLYYVKESNEEASEIIFKKYEPLIISLAKKMYPYCKNNGLEMSDLIQEGRMGLNKAIIHYEESKDKLFYTFARKCIERMMLSLVVSSSRQKHKILNESLSLEFTEEEGLGNLESVISDSSYNPEEKILTIENEKEFMEKIKDILTDTESKVFDLKLSGFNYKEIASILDKSPKSIDNTLQRIKGKIKKILN